MENMNQVDHLLGVNASDFDEDEDCYEDEDSDFEYASIQKPVFHVTREPNFDSGPPQDGLEYLRRVRWEAKRIPKVKIAKVERKVLNKEKIVYMPSIPDIAACPEQLMPSKEREGVFLDDFSKLRGMPSKELEGVFLDDFSKFRPVSVFVLFFLSFKTTKIAV